MSKRGRSSSTRGQINVETGSSFKKKKGKGKTISVEEDALKALKDQVVRECTGHLLTNSMNNARKASKGGKFEDEIMLQVETLYWAIDNVQEQVDKLKPDKGAKGLNMGSLDDLTEVISNHRETIVDLSNRLHILESADNGLGT